MIVDELEISFEAEDYAENYSGTPHLLIGEIILPPIKVR